MTKKIEKKTSEPSIKQLLVEVTADMVTALKAHIESYAQYHGHGKIKIKEDNK